MFLSLWFFTKRLYILYYRQIKYKHAYIGTYIQTYCIHAIQSFVIWEYLKHGYNQLRRNRKCRIKSICYMKKYLTSILLVSLTSLCMNFDCCQRNRWNNTRNRAIRPWERSSDRHTIFLSCGTGQHERW